MTFWDGVGYIAGALVLLAFHQKRMAPLRITALCSNVAFLTYGLALGLLPVWLLHALLLPLNLLRLAEALTARTGAINAPRSPILRRLETPSEAAAHATPWDRSGSRVRSGPPRVCGRME